MPRLLMSSFEETIQPVNVGNEYELNANLSYGFRIKPISSRLEFRTELQWGRGLNLVNGLENKTDYLMLVPQFRWSFTGSDKLTPYLELSWNYNETQYSSQEGAAQVYSNANFQAGLDAELPAKFSFSTALDMNNYYWSDTDVQKVPIWNLSISRFLLKGDRGELKLSVFDLLNKNLGIDRFADLNFFQERRIKSLGRYFMLSFTYALRQSGGPQIHMRGVRMMRRR